MFSRMTGQNWPSRNSSKCWYPPHSCRTLILLELLSCKRIPQGRGLEQFESRKGWDRPVAYFSRKLLPREKAYSTIEKECLAIVLAVKLFQICLIGKPFVIQTDHRALQWLQQFRERNTRLTRWGLQLQLYTFRVQHRRGQDNANADSLSRLDSTPHFMPEREGGSVKD